MTLFHLPFPHLVCADGGHIECVGHGTLHGITTISGRPSNVVMHDVVYMPSALHTLISLQQLLNARCCIVFNQKHGFQFFLDDQLCLFSYQPNLYYFTITFIPAMANPAARATALSVGHPLTCLDLVHHCLGHVSEECCWEFVCQSANLSKHEKQAMLLSSLLPFCSVCLMGKQTMHGVSWSPSTNHAVHGHYPGDLLLVRPLCH